ncbi:hypothetical protein [Parvicella tangerina]|nr:hypothetical protein [Parvicella tangerina]
MKITFICFFMIILNLKVVAQLLMFQETCNCGVTSAGFSTALGSGSGSFNIYIEPGATIKKAWLFAQRIGECEPVTILLNGDEYYFDLQSQITTNYNAVGGSSGIHAIDVTNKLSPITTVYNITIPAQLNTHPNAKFRNFVLWILYESPSLSKSNSSIILNDYDLDQSSIQYLASSLNPIDTNFPVGLSVYTDNIGDTTLPDGSYIYFNSQLIGLLGGADNVNSSWSWGGVKGHFYYQNNTLFGLDDDTPNNLMGGSDGLADVSSYLTNNSTNFDIRLTWQNQQTIDAANYYGGFFLTNSTSCDTFNVILEDEYRVCKGDSLQLQLLGGNDWQWETANSAPNSGLSCYNCPQPYFTDTVSRWYTVRIWNNDSCSKVLPVRMEVVDNPAPPIVTVNPTKCSDSSGVATVQIAEVSHQYSINGGALQSNNVFTGLHAGNYTITVTDTNNCSASTAITVDMTYPTAQFTANPPQGDVPLEVEFVNQSSGATNYVWYVNGDTLYDASPQVTFNEGGVFTTTLIAYDTYSQCADTVSSVILTEYPFVVFAPSIHTDRSTPYQVFTTGVSEMTYELYNEIGQLVIAKQITPVNGNNEIWQLYSLAKGVYLYRIIAKDAEGNEKEFSGKVVWQ